MVSLWDKEKAKAYKNDPLAMRVYSSRLLGSSSDLVLHGGGNTSVKQDGLLYVKGSGWDLSRIEKEGFPAVEIDTLVKMASLESLSDSEMVRLQREAMADKSFPNPSIEAILHAIIPFDVVDHTHADAVVTLTNTPDGKARIEKLYGKNMLIIDYIMPGFLLAKNIYEQTRDIDWQMLDGMILLNHGVFTFDNDAQKAYEKMIDIVDKAEKELEKYPLNVAQEIQIDADKLGMLELLSSAKRGVEVSAKVVANPHASIYASLAHLEEIISRGPLTPEHVIRTKPFPAFIDEDITEGLSAFEERYTEYFNTHATNETMLDIAPRYVVFKNKGVVVLGKDEKELTVLEDIVSHTIDAVLRAEVMERWESISPRDVFDMGYWELEQAKLKN